MRAGVYLELHKTSPEVDVFNLAFTVGDRVYTRKDCVSAIALLECYAVDVEALIIDLLRLSRAGLPQL